MRETFGGKQAIAREMEVLNILTFAKRGASSRSADLAVFLYWFRFHFE
jgi:hypothetical protein